MNPQEAGKKSKLYTGSYNSPVITGDGGTYTGSGKGISVYEFEEESAQLTLIREYSEAANASWLCLSEDGSRLYVVNELDDYEGTGGGAVSSYRVDECGGLQLQDICACMGGAPCHISCDEQGGHVYAANYNGGSLSSFILNEDGSLKRMDGQIIHRFKDTDEPIGTDPVRQEKPHVHSAAVNGGYLWITDLGMDELVCYRLDGKNGLSEEPEAILPFPAGSGPRSIAFGREDEHQLLFVTCELSNQIAVLSWRVNVKELKLLHMITSLPEGHECSSSLADIVLRPDMDGNGWYLYAGNRGHDSLVVCHVDNAGNGEAVQWISTQGSNPRGIRISPSGKWVLAANQSSGNLVIYRVDETSGMLNLEREYEMDEVVCLQFSNENQ